MRLIAIAIITFYQMFISLFLNRLLGVQDMCRYAVPCSEYAKHVIANHGVYKGSLLAINRLLHCQPFVKVYEHI